MSETVEELAYLKQSYHGMQELLFCKPDVGQRPISRRQSPEQNKRTAGDHHKLRTEEAFAINQRNAREPPLKIRLQVGKL